MHDCFAFPVRPVLRAYTACTDDVRPADVALAVPSFASIFFGAVAWACLCVRGCVWKEGGGQEGGFLFLAGCRRTMTKKFMVPGPSLDHGEAGPGRVQGGSPPVGRTRHACSGDGPCVCVGGGHACMQAGMG